VATTVKIEMDSERLERLRARHPGKSDREVIERLATIELGMAVLRERDRVDADQEDVVPEYAVQAVHEARANHVTRVVIDASVLASAAGGHPASPSRRLFDAPAEGRIGSVLCEGILQEPDRALDRPYFAARVTTAEREAVVAVLRASADIHPDPVAQPKLLRDPNDDYLVALARSAGAEAIVTGEGDLLDHVDLVPPAITPREACGRFGLP
jgi:putative PIN family toxin of toxin-antitoxin system